MNKRIALSFGLLIACTSAIVAQGLTGSIVGTVTDPANAAVPNAKVTVKNVDTNPESQTTTDSVGTYRPLGLVAASYTVTVEAPGFRKMTTSPQPVDVASPLRV